VCCVWGDHDKYHDGTRVRTYSAVSVMNPLVYAYVLEDLAGTANRNCGDQGGPAHSVWVERIAEARPAGPRVVHRRASARTLLSAPVDEGDLPTQRYPRRPVDRAVVHPTRPGHARAEGNNAGSSGPAARRHQGAQGRHHLAPPGWSWCAQVCDAACGWVAGPRSGGVQHRPLPRWSSSRTYCQGDPRAQLCGWESGCGAGWW
jgi:hypothetical protein